MSEQQISFNFRPMSRADLGRVYEIECASYVYPWSMTAFQAELASPRSHFILAVSRGGEGKNGLIMGYTGFRHLANEMHVINVAVHPRFRRRGMGRALLRWVLEAARNLRCSRVNLEVRRSNLVAQQLYRGEGFVAVGLRRRYYQGGEDAILMSRFFNNTGPGGGPAGA